MILKIYMPVLLLLFCFILKFCNTSDNDDNNNNNRICEILSIDNETTSSAGNLFFNIDNATEDSITIGFLGAYGQAQILLGALPLAIEAINNDENLLPGKTLNYVAGDIGILSTSGFPTSRPSSTQAIRIMTEMRDKGAVAFIGPDATCFAEALVATAWNLPLISYRCSDTKVSDKTTFTTFARTLPPSSKVSKSVVALLIAFKWNKFVVVCGTDPASGSQVQEAIEELSVAHGLTVTETKKYRDYIPRYIEQMDKIVAETYQKTRVYVFLGEHIALVDFIKCLQLRNLLETGDYVVISVDDEIYDSTKKTKIVSRDYLDPWISGSNLESFRSVLKFTQTFPKDNNDKIITNFRERIKTSSTKPPFCVPYHHKIFDSISVPIEAAFLYDAVMIYARALTEILEKNGDPKNGTDILDRILNRPYHSVIGYDVFIDRNGDAEGNFSVLSLLEDKDADGNLSMTMQPVGYFQYIPNGTAISNLPEFRYYNASRPIQWPGGKIPKDEPPCGFHGEKCVYQIDWKLVAGAVMVTSALVIASLFAFKHYRYEQKLACLLWKIEMSDVEIPKDMDETKTTKNTSCNTQLRQFQKKSFKNFNSRDVDEFPERAYTKIGHYKGNFVAIKDIHKKTVDLTRSILKELKEVRELRHENINPFVGASIDHGQVAILTAYANRGSLEDVLANDDINLDDMLIPSLVSDLLKGMIYLHESEIISHGRLKSSNCLIDNRWVLQITDFGLHEFKSGQDDPNFAMKEMKSMLWRAPELLRMESPPARGTQKGDVYSFGIVLYEIIGRAGPWGDITMEPSAIIREVSKENPDVPFRPSLYGLKVETYIINCFQACWFELPEQRPDMSFVRTILNEMLAGLKSNILDNMLAVMERYSSNLESIVQDRTNQLIEEKKKTDKLLYSMLPISVADALKRGEEVEAESFECVTIYFSDIVGFTELSAVSTPLQIINLLNELYTLADSIILDYDVYKVETIGDAYMVVSGLPIRNENRHAGEIASMALQLLKKVSKFEIKHRPGEMLNFRIGIHSGQVVAGFVGKTMPRYCLFGDTVNTASRMESSGEEGKVHISKATYTLLQELGGYICQDRGNIKIKGKGEMYTYWLLSEDPKYRLTRLPKKTEESTSCNSINSEMICETPDLLHLPGKQLIAFNNNIRKYSSSSITRLHQKDKKAYCSDEAVQHGSVTSQRPLRPGIHQSITSYGPRSAPTIKFT